MTTIEVLAFIVTPLAALAVGWGVALWAVRAAR